MFSHETFQTQMSAVMEALVEAAVAEMRRLLEQCSMTYTTKSCLVFDNNTEEDMTTEGTQQKSNGEEEDMTTEGTQQKSDGEENNMTLQEGTQQLQAMTSQFASLMGKWTKNAVEKMALLLKVSMSEDVSRPAPKKRVGVKCKTSRNIVKHRAGEMDGAKNESLAEGSCKERNNSAVELEIKETKRGEGPDVTQDDDAPQRPSKRRLRKKGSPTGSQLTTVKQEPQATQIEETQEVYSGSPLSTDEHVDTQFEPTSELSDEEEVIEELTANTGKSKKKKEPIKCPSCEKTFAKKCFFEKHFLSHSKPHSCSQCGKRFATQGAMESHVLKHTGEKLFTCSECGTGFAYKSTYNRHMTQHKLKREKIEPIKKYETQTCAYCEAEFAGKFAFQRHKCSALEKTLRCSLCPKTFECRQSLADHENLHSGERDFVCEMCGECFFSSSSLTTHRVAHLNEQSEKKPFSCEVCGKVCSHQSALKHHMLKHGVVERTYACETCGKKCAHASALQNHMRVHTGEKPGQRMRPDCDVCGKTLSSFTKLKYHMSIHTGDKPYSCDLCSKSFRNPMNLKKHSITHTGEKLHGCNICGRRFTVARSLKCHLFLHTGEWPFECPVCGKKYHQKSELKKHQQACLLKVEVESDRKEGDAGADV